VVSLKRGNLDKALRCLMRARNVYGLQGITARIFPVSIILKKNRKILYYVYTSGTFFPRTRREIYASRCFLVLFFTCTGSGVLPKCPVTVRRVW
jgi:hypothetical protein